TTTTVCPEVAILARLTGALGSCLLYGCSDHCAAATGLEKSSRAVPVTSAFSCRCNLWPRPLAATPPEHPLELPMPNPTDDTSSIHAPVEPPDADDASIIFPVYNCAKLIAETTCSVRDESIGEARCVIVGVDDGSTDSSPSILFE